MSIQSTINQGISLAGYLFSQSNLSKGMEATRNSKIKVREANRLAGEIIDKMDEGYFNKNDPEIQAKYKATEHLVSNLSEAHEKAFDARPSARAANNLVRGYKADARNKIELENLKKDMENEDLLTAVDDAIADVDYDVAYNYGIQDVGYRVARVEMDRGLAEAEVDSMRAAQEEATRRAQANLKLEQERLGYMGYTTPSGIVVGPTYGGPRKEIKDA